MDRLTQTSENGGVALTFDLDVTCEKSEILKILKMAEKLKMYEDMEEKIEKEIDDIVKSENYPHLLEKHDERLKEKIYKQAIKDMKDNLIRNSRTEIIDGEITLIVTEDRINVIATEMLERT